MPSPLHPSHPRSLRVRLALLALAGFLAQACSPGPPAPDLIAPSAPSPSTGIPSPSAEATGSPQPAPWFEEVAAERGIDFVHDSGHQERFLFPEMSSGGAALFDMDADGDLDAYLVQGGEILADPASRPANQLYRNLGGGRFENASAGSGAEDRGYGMGVAAGDYDNDGLTDLYVTNLGANTLLRNLGDGRFEDRSASASVSGDDWSASAAFLDIDADGWLDLYVVNYVHWNPDLERDCYTDAGRPDYCGPNSYASPAQDRLYRNNQDGTFSDISASAGLDTALGNGLGLVPGDFDLDGLPDVFVANDGMPDQLWHNRGQGRFEDLAPLLGVAVDESGRAKAGMGTHAEDVDDDGDLDLLVVNLMGESDSLYLNQGDYFSDASAQSGLIGLSRGFTRFGLGLVDFDNDGRLDIYQANGRVRWQSDILDPADLYAEPNLVLRGQPDGRYVEQLPRGGTARLLIHTSRAAAFGDIDDDGRIDILVANRDAPPYLLHNITAASGHWLTVRLLTPAGRDALGATLDLITPDRRIHRESRSAYSYCAANDPRIHIGLGPTDTVDALLVRWPDGTRESFPAPPLDHPLTLTQGTGTPQP